MSWTFHSSDHPQPTARGRAEDLESTLHYLQHREAELVRRLVSLKERRAFYPNEVSPRQVSELAAKLDELRARIDHLVAHRTDP